MLLSYYIEISFGCCFEADSGICHISYVDVSITLFPRVPIIAPLAMRFLLTVRGDFLWGGVILANIFKDLWWLLPRFFDLNHMISKRFSKKVNFSFSLSMTLAFLEYFVSRRVYETEQVWPNNKITCSIKVTSFLLVPQQPRQTVLYDCPLTLSINGIKEPLLPKFLREIFPFAGLV